MSEPALPLSEATGFPPADAPPRRPSIRLVFEVEEQPERWLLEEETMPESTTHDQCLILLQDVLQQHAHAAGRDALVARNLACRWDPNDARVGVDPDLCLIEPAPPQVEFLEQLHIWKRGHSVPRLGVEVVSRTTANKDYFDAPARYTRLGVRELWVFDPFKAGPEDTGGPFVLQVWRLEGGHMRRIHAGPSPAFSPEVGAWLVVTDGGLRLRLADDEQGKVLWPTAAEAKEAARQQEAQARQLAEAETKVEQAARQQAEQAQQIAENERHREAAARQQAEKEREREVAARQQAEREREAAEKELAALRLRLADLEKGRG